MKKNQKQSTKGILAQETILDHCKPALNGKPIALVYPNSYKVAMASLGYLTVYRILVETGFKPERFFFDVKDSLDVPVSVESGKKLKGFDTIAVHLSFELDYVNLIKMLNSSGINPHRTEREKSTGQKIIAGGVAVTANPLPLLNFIDAAFIGEFDGQSSLLLADEEFPNLINANQKGWFLSSEYEENPNQSVEQYNNPNWHEFESYSPIVTPDSAFGKINLIEITSGCPIKCKFCLAGNMHCDVRERSASLILDGARHHIGNADKVGLIGAIPSTHSEIVPILEELIAMKLKPTLSSLSVASLSPDILTLLAEGGMKTLTLGVESFDADVQRQFGKRVSFEKLSSGIVSGLEAGMKDVKLYLMMGLPDAPENEQDQIISHALDLVKIIRKSKPGSKLTLSLNPFIPKIATLYRDQQFIGEKQFRDKINFIRKNLSPKGIAVNSESHKGSYLQYLLSCGNEKMGVIIEESAKGVNPKQSVRRYLKDIKSYLNDSSKQIDRVIIR